MSILSILSILLLVVAWLLIIGLGWRAIRETLRATRKDV